ncbi:MAG TPA: glycosyltransferase family 2 protein [Geminicoccaceae bacterium]|nr:glycosyltransferase family 2 protein [Geminicoccaceae bacterium]
MSRSRAAMPQADTSPPPGHEPPVERRAAQDARRPRAEGEAPPDGCELTILLPCLDEAATLAGCVERAQGFLRRHGVSGEVLVADNGSTDGSQAIALRHGARVVEVATRGYGAALLGGIRAARGRFVIMGDADGSYDFAALEGFVSKLREGCELVVGNRFSGGIRPGAMPPLNRYLGNPVLSALGRRFFRVPIGDFHCGLRGFDRRAIERLGLGTTGMEFASEMIVKASLEGLRIDEVPTVLAPDGRGRPSHLRPWRDGWRHLRFLLLYAPAWLFLYPGLALVVLGLVACLAVLPGPLVLGSVVFDVHTLVMATGALVVGAQTIVFFLIAKEFATNQGLLPSSRRFRALRVALSLERLVAGGLALVGLGLVGCVAALVAWGRADFGNLDYGWMMRLIVPSVAALALGVQAVFAGFLLSLLDLKRRPRVD